MQVDISGAPKVLVIEDSKVIRRLIEVCLRPLDVDVDLVGDGVAGLESAAVERPDVVVLDIGLPGMDGWAVLEVLRTAAEGVPVLMLTGHGEMWSEQHALQQGAIGFMTKPFLPDLLRERVADLLDNPLVELV
jgi:DNA-binding response OmpR family regulator